MFLMSPGGIFGIIALVIVAIAIIVVIIRSIVIVPQATIVIVQRLGKYARTLPAGIHILTPIIEKKVQSVSLKE